MVPAPDSLLVERVSESERVLAWRLLCLLQDGYAEADAEALAASSADLHRIADLIAAGCPLKLAADILS